MRIAYFVDDFPVISQLFILNQITGMIDSGDEVQIFAFRESPSSSIHEIVHKYKLLDRVKYIEPLPHGKLATIIRIAQMLIRFRFAYSPKSIIKALITGRQNQNRRWLNDLNDVLQISHQHFDIIHCQFGTIAPRVLNLIDAGVLKGRLVTSFRGFDATKYASLYPNVYANLFRRGDRFLPVSESIRSNLIELECLVSKISIMHSGLDLRKFQFHEKAPPKIDPVKVITVARLVDKKGINFSISAVKKTIDAGFNVQYFIVGEGPLLGKLRNLVDQLGIKERVEFLGVKSHSEVIGLLKQSHILIAPSITSTDGDKEGIPNVMKEAMAVGVPVIGTRHGGIPELIDHEISGFLVDEQDDQGLSDMLIRLCENPGIWRDLCWRARKTIEDEYDIEKLNRELRLIYKSLF